MPLLDDCCGIFISVYSVAILLLQDGFYDGEMMDGRQGLVPSNFIEEIPGKSVKQQLKLRLVAQKLLACSWLVVVTYAVEFLPLLCFIAVRSCDELYRVSYSVQMKSYSSFMHHSQQLWNYFPQAPHTRRLPMCAAVTTLSVFSCRCLVVVVQVLRWQVCVLYCLSHLARR